MSQEINIKIGVEAKEANQTVGQFKQNLQGIDNAQKNVADSSKKASDGFKQTGSSIKNLGLEGASRGVEKMAAGFSNLKLSNIAGGFRMLGAAIASNPIGAIATAVLALVSAFGGLEGILNLVSGSFGDMAASQKIAKEITDTSISSYAKEKVALENLFEPLNDVSLSSEKRKNIIGDINKKYGEYLPNLLTEKSTNEEIAKAYDLVNASLIRKSITQAKVSALEEVTSKRLKEVVEIEKRRQRLIETGASEALSVTSINNQLKISEDAYNSNIKSINEASKSLEKQLGITDELSVQIDKQSENRKKSDEDKIKSNNKVVTETKKNTEDISKIQNEAFKLIKQGLDDEVQNVEKNRIEKLASYQQDFLDGKITFETLQAEKVLLEKEANEEIIAIREGFRISDVEKIKIGFDNLKKLTDDNQKEIGKITQENLDIDVNLTKNYNDWKKKEDEEAAEFKEQQRLEDIEREKEASEVRKKINEEEEEKKRAEAVETQKLAFEFASASLSAISTLTDIVFENRKSKAEAGSKAEEALARKQFQINKALQLGTAVINGIQSILAITSVPDFTFGVQSALRIGAQVVLNVASIAKIAAQTFQPTATSATSPSLPSTTGAGAAPQTPTFTPTSFFGLGQTTQFNPQEQGPTRVYVTEGDISNTQNRVRVVENRARFG